MPKIKTKSGTKKRFRLTASGKVIMFASGKRHNLSKDQIKQKETLEGHKLCQSRIVELLNNI